MNAALSKKIRQMRRMRFGNEPEGLAGQGVGQNVHAIKLHARQGCLQIGVVVPIGALSLGQTHDEVFGVGVGAQFGGGGRGLPCDDFGEQSGGSLFKITFKINIQAA